MKTVRALHVLLLMALFGALTGTLGDQIHVQFHVLFYPHGVSWLDGQAVWVPFLFALGGPLLIYSHWLSTRLAGGDVDSLPKSTAWKPGVWHFAAYFSTGLFFMTPRVLTAGLVAAWLVRVALHPSRAMVVHSIGCAILGPLFEMALSSTGAFVYTRPTYIIPMWLPALYLHVAPACRHIYLAWVKPSLRS